MIGSLALALRHAARRMFDHRPAPPEWLCEHYYFEDDCLVCRRR